MAFPSRPHGSGDSTRGVGPVLRMRMSRWQLVRTWLHLYFVGLKRRMVLGTRIVVLDGDRVLLLRHTYVPGWHFPGGGVEPGETAADAAARELEEEAGIAPAEPLQLHGLFHNVHRATNRDHVALFVCRSFTKTKRFAPNMEVAELGWFPLDRLPDSVAPGVARRLAEIASGLPPEPRW